MSSQQTFQSVLGKFSDGIDLLKDNTAYSPARAELTLTALEAQKADAEAKNAAVVSKGTLLTGLRNNRRIMSFKSKDSDANCLEIRIKAIASYIKAEHGATDPAYLKIKSIISRFQPPHEKKTKPAEGEEPKKSISKSEKTYQSLVGFSSDIYTIISGLGENYNPSNQNITLEGFKAKLDELSELNSNIVKAENDYMEAVKERNEVFNGEAGIKSIVSSIKDYLASLEGGKKNPDYVAFMNAVK